MYLIGLDISIVTKKNIGTDIHVSCMRDIDERYRSNCLIRSDHIWKHRSDASDLLSDLV